MGHSLDVLALAGPPVGVSAVLGYLWLVARDRGRRWSRWRSVSWITGVLIGTAGISGPLARAAQGSFAAHMITHLLIGMAAPLLLVRAAPVSLLLRSLPVGAARHLSRVLGSPPVEMLTEPGVAAVLNVGGLWLLYTTGIYPAMLDSMTLHVAVHLHVFAAGYLFSMATVGVDPAPHRRSFLHRGVVLTLALAAHDILAKQLYVHPPTSVAEADAHTGSMIMYYGGDAVDLIIIVLLGAAWFRAGRSPRKTSAADHRPTTLVRRVRSSSGTRTST